MIWIDGQLRGCDATVSVFDRGFLYGDGLFETLPVYAGRPFLLDDHLARLMQGTQVLRMANAPAIDDWRAAVSALLDAERPDCATLRLWISRGVNTGIGLGCGAATRPTWIAACMPARRYDTRIYDEGMVLALSTREHAMPSQSPTGTKHANYLASILAFDDAQNAGADEALLCNPRGNLCEGAFSNLFAVIDDVLVTPPLDEGPLAGTARARLLGLAASAGIAHAETAIPLARLADASELMVSNALLGIAPVRAVLPRAGHADDPTPSLALPGPVARRLSAEYAALVASETGARWPLIA
jgi:branched-chain amino acid aminotransferase